MARADSSPAARRRWQREHLVELGCTEAEAAKLMVAGVDWHDLERLLKDGCPLDVAIRILL